MLVNKTVSFRTATELGSSADNSSGYLVELRMFLEWEANYPNEIKKIKLSAYRDGSDVAVDISHKTPFLKNSEDPSSAISLVYAWSSNANFSLLHLGCGVFLITSGITVLSDLKTTLCFIHFTLPPISTSTYALIETYAWTTPSYTNHTKINLGDITSFYVIRKAGYTSTNGLSIFIASVDKRHVQNVAIQKDSNSAAYNLYWTSNSVLQLFSGPLATAYEPVLEWQHNQEHPILLTKPQPIEETRMMIQLALQKMDEQSGYNEKFRALLVEFNNVLKNLAFTLDGDMVKMLLGQATNELQKVVDQITKQVQDMRTEDLVGEVTILKVATNTLLKIRSTLLTLVGAK